MFQTFDSHASPDQGPPRLAALRGRLREMGLDGFLIPRSDVHQGEYVAARDERLQWLTGFTGSAGFCIVLPEVAGVFIDGRYRTQVKAQVALGAFTPVPWPDVKPGDWIRENLAAGTVGFDPWLHTSEEIEKLEVSLEGSGVKLLSVRDNPVDAIWPDQPAAPVGKVFVHPDALAGESHADKRARLAGELQKAGQRAVVLTLPDSISWLLNIRGADVPKNPVVHAFAILRDDGRVDLFLNPTKTDDAVLAHLGAEVTLAYPGDLRCSPAGACGAGAAGQGLGPAGGRGYPAGRGRGGPVGRRPLPAAEGAEERGRDCRHPRGPSARRRGDGGIPVLA